MEGLAHRVFEVLLAHNPHVGEIWTYRPQPAPLLHLVRDLRSRAYRPGESSSGNDRKPPSWPI